MKFTIGRFDQNKWYESISNQEIPENHSICGFRGYFNPELVGC